jgi:bacterioferritin
MNPTRVRAFRGGSESLGEYALAEQIRRIFVQEQNHQIDLATALGEDVQGVSEKTE